ncbi:MAG TPA: hypothetical protein PLL30_00115 [Candidatus Krumholzibacteria bacterium]|nr:hypothetical protein [Candidatus Krumholzibacteria bacterium]HPD70162.1 hypothetical protein [Candidatus Krumholzibacteria bacterium]HRY40138.1 hypothetical protein [Candidatus Krumholzibacteria bacterium]
MSHGHDLDPPITRITEVRSEYTSARLICANLEHRVRGTRYERAPGYLPAEIDYRASDGRLATIQVRDYDVRFLDRVVVDRAAAHVDLIRRARCGDEDAQADLRRITADLYPKIAARFAGPGLVENDWVIPYTTERDHPQTQISHKGAILLQLSRQGFATPDFNLLAGGVYRLPADQRRSCTRDAIHNLEKLSGRILGDPVNPLLIAMRSAMPQYLPGFMPTYLNVGLTPALLPGLPARYGDDAAARIRLNARRTLLEALDPEAAHRYVDAIRPDLSRQANDDLSAAIESLIAASDPRLLDDPYHQIDFFLERIYAYYERHFDALRSFMTDAIVYPTVILQRMVCSVIDKESYAGVLYSRHPRLGTGVHLQYARAIYGEDLMTGRLVPQEIHLQDAQAARASFPAVHHFWRRLPQLEQIFGGPVMVEFTGVHGTFTILQVNEAELSGAGMLTAVMNLYRAGEIGAQRVRELIKPYHVRQLESDAIDPRSLESLEPFCRGVSVLPRSAVSGRVYFASERVAHGHRRRDGDSIILVKARFEPTDAITMQTVQGICSLSPAAIHVVTTAQTLGIPALLDLEKDGVRIGGDGRTLVNRAGRCLAEGDWVTVSSRQKTLYMGKAVFAPARLLRFMDGEDVEFGPHEREKFELLATYFREYRRLVENATESEFTSLQDLGHALRSGNLRAEPDQSAQFVDRCFDANRDRMVERLFETTLGMHLSNQVAFRLLSVDRQAALLAAAVRAGRDRGRTGYQAGAFVIGSLVAPDAPAALWRCLAPDEVGLVLNEWVLHQKYRDILGDVGERKLNLAKGVILSQGLGRLLVHVGLVKQFMPLKLSGVDLAAVRRELPASAEPETGEVVDALRRPYREFFDFDRPAERARLASLCADLGRPVPDRDDT